MDCKNARLLLEVAHPLATELDVRDKSELAGHLADCPECGPWAESEHRVDEAFGNAMRAVPMPEGFPLQIMRRLHIERDAWYRGWAVRAAGVAAALLLAVWASWAMWLGKKPALDGEAILFEADRMLYKPEQVEQAFADKGVTMLAPPGFDYGLLDSLGMADFHGKKVPYLLFFYRGGKNPQNQNDIPPAVAKVYVLCSRQFNLDDVKSPSLAGSRINIKIRPHDKNPTFFYVIVYPVGTDERIFQKFTAPSG